MFLSMMSLRRLVIALAAWFIAGAVQANVLQEISYSALPGNRVDIVLTLAEPVAEPASFTTDNPARIAIDLPGTSSALKTKLKNIGVGVVRSVVAIEGEDRTRVVVNLLESVPHQIA
ncbi:MAG: AMIN domain-containing protein, partial [Gammaproteobacteria bacterium]